MDNKIMGPLSTAPSQVGRATRVLPSSADTLKDVKMLPIPLPLSPEEKDHQFKLSTAAATAAAAAAAAAATTTTASSSSTSTSTSPKRYASFSLPRALNPPFKPSDQNLSLSSSSLVRPRFAAYASMPSSPTSVHDLLPPPPSVPSSFCYSGWTRNPSATPFSSASSSSLSSSSSFTVPEYYSYSRAADAKDREPVSPPCRVESHSTYRQLAKDYDKLQARYDRLSAAHTALQREFDDMQSNYDGLFTGISATINSRKRRRTTAPTGTAPTGAAAAAAAAAAASDRSPKPPSDRRAPAHLPLSTPSAAYTAVAPLNK